MRSALLLTKGGVGRRDNTSCKDAWFASMDEAPSSVILNPDTPHDERSDMPATATPTKRSPIRPKVVRGVEQHDALLKQAQGKLGVEVRPSPKGHYESLRLHGKTIAYVWAPSARGVRVELRLAVEDLPKPAQTHFRAIHRSAFKALTLIEDKAGVDRTVRALGIAAKQLPTRVEKKK
jgi:hypothetical protein